MIHIQQITRRPVIYIPVLLFCLALAGYFGTRGILLRKAISSVNSRIRNFHYAAHWDEVRFKGINRVFARGIYIQSEKGNNEIHIDSASVRVRLLPLLTKNVIIRRLDCRSLTIRYFSVDSINMPVVEHADSSGTFDFLMDRDLAAFAYKHLRRFFNHVPSKLHFRKIEARYNYAGKTTLMVIRNLNLRNASFSAELSLTENESLVKMPFSGKFDNSTSIIEFHITNADTGLLPLPVLRDRFGIAAGFDSLDFLMNLGQRNRHLLNIKGELKFAGFELNGERLSTGNISVGRFQSAYRVLIGPDFIELDSSTAVLLNDIMLNPFLKLTLESAPKVNFKILPQHWNAEDFFNSLPPGMFTSLVGTQARGFLDFFLDFSVDLELPDSLYFNMKLEGDDFKILSYGSDDYRILNRGFLHRVYQRGNLVASFPVGPENPDFVPFEDISPFLRAAVMTSEDGSFFYHNGFNPGAFRESIATNIKEGGFARGGSTISMQLVKNVFLTRNKTIARKIEEALIVWLIENNNLVSKQRMYEVYLNIIEWGPGVYGARQASRFYFEKSPSELNLQESVFLASIVPRPRWYRYTFETNGAPRPFFAVYFNRLKELMVRKEFISAFDTLGVIPSVTLTGPAANVFDTTGSIPVDSVTLMMDILPNF